MIMHVSTNTPESSAGRPDAISLLTADHQKVSRLFEQYQSALDDDHTSEQQALAEQICRALEIHTEIEEEIFYPAVAREDALKALVDEALTEHGEVKEAIRQLKGMQADDAEFAALMLQMMEDVEHHVDEEENVMFPEVEKRLAGQLNDLGTRLQERKEQLTGSEQARP